MSSLILPCVALSVHVLALVSTPSSPLMDHSSLTSEMWLINSEPERRLSPLSISLRAAGRMAGHLILTQLNGILSPHVTSPKETIWLR